MTLADFLAFAGFGLATLVWLIWFEWWWMHDGTGPLKSWRQRRVGEKK